MRGLPTASRGASIVSAIVLSSVFSASARAQESPEPAAASSPPEAANPRESAPPAKEAPALPASAAAPAEPSAIPRTGFSFGSYGRMIGATDGRGRAGRDADIVAHGSRLDEANYVELELRRDDDWARTGATTRLVATLGIANPVFHYTGNFDIKMAVRNLYIEERGLLDKGLSVWAGSRMYRGDDVYLLDFWPLDNLNTVGAGARYQHGEHSTSVDFQVGLNEPDSKFFHQDVSRPLPQNQIGATSVAVLDRQRFVSSLKATHIVPMEGGGGLKGVGYAELHLLPEGQRESDPRQFETLPSDGGYVIGVQAGAFTGQRDTHVNLFLRYAHGLAAYGELATPTQLSLDRTASGAHEILAALGANWESGPFGVMFGGYLRSFRDATDDLDFEDVDEAIVAVRPHVFFGESGGVAVEGSYQVAQHGVLWASEEDRLAGRAPEGPLSASLVRFGVVPFLSPAGRGDYSRPQLRLIYTVTLRSDAAKSLYARDDVFGLRGTEHFLGIGAEWWFNSSSYGG